MIRRLQSWYGRLAPLKKLVVVLCLHWIYWFFAWWFAYQLMMDETQTLTYRILHSLWMAVFITATSNWSLVKAVFRRRDDDNSAPTSIE